MAMAEVVENDRVRPIAEEVKMKPLQVLANV
jgi:hypothetical protein